MQHGRGIVSGIHTLQRITDDRAAQIPFQVPRCDTLVHGLAQVAAGDVDVLTDLHEDNCHAGVLADRKAGFTRSVKVGTEVGKDCLAGGRLFFRAAAADALLQCRGQLFVCLYAQIADGFRDPVCMKLSHGFVLLAGILRFQYNTKTIFAQDLSGIFGRYRFPMTETGAVPCCRNRMRPPMLAFLGKMCYTNFI